MKISPHVIRIGGIFGAGVWGANVYLLIDDKLTLVDTGFKGRANQILRKVKQLGFSPSDISRIIITHHHADHIGSLAMLKKITGAMVLAHSADAPYIDGRLPQPGPVRPSLPGKFLHRLGLFFPVAPSTVDQAVNEGDVLPIIGGLKVLHTPGHTPGSICIFSPEERVLLAGDLLANRFRLGLPSKTFTADMKQEINSIKRLVKLDFDIICFGHGAPITHHAGRAVTDLIRKLESSI